MSNEQLSNWKLAAFASPAIPLAALGAPLGIFLPAFYASEMGLSLTAVGAIFMITRLFDLVTDPLVGVLTDKFPSKYGRRRHWMVIAVPLLLPPVFFLFWPQYIVGPGNSVSETYLLITLIAVYVGFTLSAVSHTSWAAELSDDYDDRARIIGWREWAFLLGMALVLVAPIAIEQMGGETSSRQRIQAMGMFLLFVFPLATALSVFAIPERPYVQHARLSWRRAMSVLLNNRLMMRILSVDLLIAVPSAVRGVLFVFFVEQVVRSPEWTSIILVSYFLAGVIAVPPWVFISKRIGKHRAVALAVALHLTITIGYLFIGPGDVLIFAAMFFGTGLFMSATPLLLRAITADITDHDDLESGQRRSGLFFGLITMTHKFGSAIGIGIAFPLLDAIGFDPNGAMHQDAIDGMRYMFVFFPVIAELIVIMLIYNFPLGKDQQLELRKKLQERSV